MIITIGHSSRAISITRSELRCGERGAALATAILMLGLLSAIALTVLAVVHNEVRIAGSDLVRTQSCYASAAGIEKMTSDFSALFAHTSRPSPTQLSNVESGFPTELTAEGFTAVQTLAVDSAELTAMGPNPTVTIPLGPFAGLKASKSPYLLTTTTNLASTQCKLTRQMNNYLIPLFQFGMFSDEDIELHPGPAFTFNGRVHANGNIYVTGAVKFLDKVTTANEFIFDRFRNNSVATSLTVSMQVGAINVPITKGSMKDGPNIPTATASPAGQRGYFPGSPDGTINAAWDNTSVSAPSAGSPNKFGGQLLTRSTGASLLKLPLQLDGNPVREIIKRRMPNDSPLPPAPPSALSESRYHSKAQIRVLLDDEIQATADASGIPAGQGVLLSTFDPIPLPNIAASAGATGGGRALWRMNDDGTYGDASTTCVTQQNGGAGGQALTVRGVKAATQVNQTPYSSTIAIPRIPGGAGISGRILIEIVDVNGVARDVTREILSLGMTEGEPNSIVTLQRPLWAAFTQGNRDASNSQNTAPDGTKYFDCLTDIMDKTYMMTDGEILTSPGPVQNPTAPNIGYLNAILDDAPVAGQPQRSDTPPSAALTSLFADWGTGNWATNKDWNAIVPINVYNVREGLINSSMAVNAIYERGITSVVELNMRNLARWVDGVYDANLLTGTNAVSANIGSPDGWTVYVSDRRGDKVKAVVDSSGANINSTNGMVDNEDIYGPNGLLDPGEDVQNKGVLVKDTTELPDPALLPISPAPYADYGTDRYKRAIAVAAWANPNNYFRRAVRLFRGEDLQITGAANKLSATKGITVATENLFYIWGNYNTTGINGQPAGASTLNDSTQANFYLGNQVPASIVGDALFPLSRTFFDSQLALYPDQLAENRADLNIPGVGSETAVRAGIIAGNNLSALAGNPDAGNTASGESRLNGGMHNFPRFLEDWTNLAGVTQRWNFVGSLIPLYHSTQAVGQYNANSVIYSPPTRNWAFDTTFLQVAKLPPGTPQFQYIDPTAFRQVLY